MNDPYVVGLYQRMEMRQEGPTVNKMKSRKLWVAIGTILTIAGGALQGTITTDAAISQIVPIVVAYLVAEGGVDIARALKG